MKKRHRRGALAAILGLPVGMAAGAAAAQASRPAPHGDLAARLDALESKHQISEVLLAYARANDRMDEALLRSCFWPESTHKHGAFEGSSSGFIDYALKVVRSLKFAAHHISNISVEVRGDQAFSESHYFAHHRRVAKDGSGEEDAFFEGRYLDRLERRNGVWKIIHRRGLADYSAVAPATTPYAKWPAGQHSLPHPHDDYYAMAARFRAER